MESNESAEPDEWLESTDGESMEDLLAGFADLDDSCSLEDLSQAYAQLLADQERLTESLSPESLGAGRAQDRANFATDVDAERANSGADVVPASRLADGARRAAGSHHETDRGTQDESKSAADAVLDPGSPPASALSDLRRLIESAAGQESEDRVAITPIRILEALLFVGTPDNTPLSGRQLAALMRGVSPEEIDAYVDQLNAQYQTEGAAYGIAKQPTGYCLELATTHAHMRNPFYGQVREVKLAQPVIDVLALVAYHQPVSKREIEKLLGAPCGGSLSQLLRRNLIALTKEPAPVGAVYRTTPRFLDLFDLESLDDLPRSESWES